MLIIHPSASLHSRRGYASARCQQGVSSGYGEYSRLQRQKKPDCGTFLLYSRMQTSKHHSMFKVLVDSVKTDGEPDPAGLSRLHRQHD